MIQTTVDIYCDGACSHNPGVGGWGVVFVWQNTTTELYGYEADSTNNRMELLAAINALVAIKNDTQINMYTDSMYVQKGITEWINNWKRTNWKNGKIKNIDLWQTLDSLASKKQIKWYWIKGHAGYKYNEIADRLATNAIKEYMLHFIDKKNF